VLKTISKLLPVLGVVGLLVGCAQADFGIDRTGVHESTSVGIPGGPGAAQHFGVGPEGLDTGAAVGFYPFPQN
jgi:hypothetical protein